MHTEVAFLQEPYWIVYLWHRERVSPLYTEVPCFQELQASARRPYYLHITLTLKGHCEDSDASPAFSSPLFDGDVNKLTVCTAGSLHWERASGSYVVAHRNVLYRAFPRTPSNRGRKSSEGLPALLRQYQW